MHIELVLCLYASTSTRFKVLTDFRFRNSKQYTYNIINIYCNIIIIIDITWRCDGAPLLIHILHAMDVDVVQSNAKKY